MFFTREPIIESIITPKEGYKLLVRSSKGSSQEHYSVESVEIVSFGSSIFYRSTEKPKAFLLPIQDYEVLECKETRIVLKNASPEGSIKISAAKDSPSNEAKDPPKKRRSRRKRTAEKLPEKKVELEEPTEAATPSTEEEPSYLSKLLPPPPVLIKESLTKLQEQEVLEANLYTEEGEKGSPQEEQKELVLSPDAALDLEENSAPSTQSAPTDLPEVDAAPADE
ncbi:MAG: hypothetical protein AAGF04_02045 [Chlamydiota bacterium]